MARPIQLNHWQARGWQLLIGCSQKVSGRTGNCGDRPPGSTQAALSIGSPAKMASGRRKIEKNWINRGCVGTVGVAARVGLQAKGLKSSPSGPTSTQNCSLMRPADFSLMHPEFAAPLSCRLQSRGSETLETGLRGSGHHPASHRPFPKPSNGARQIEERTIRALLIRIS